MACALCGAAEQRGRFCVRCGRTVRSSPRPAPRRQSPLTEALTEPVLRLGRPSRPPVPAR